MTGKSITLIVNNQPCRLELGDRHGAVKNSHSLAHTLRENLGLTGTKLECGKGECGACTILIDGKAVLSCLTLTIECDGKRITTIEGLEDPQTGELDPVQQSFLDSGAFQCGYCTPGIIMSVKALLDTTAASEEGKIEEALSGHYCRCISHYHVLDAVKKLCQKAGNENG